MLVRKNNK